MKTAVRALERSADWLLIGLFTLIFGLVLAQVVCRYVFNSPLVWSEELARLAFVWTAMLAWSLGSRKRSHIAIGFAAGMLPLGPRLVLQVAIQVAVIVLCALLVWHGSALTVRNIDLPTVTLGISYAALYIVVPLGALIVALYSLAEIWDLLTKRRALDEAKAEPIL